MEISRKAWNRYLVRLRNLSSKAADELMKYMQNGHDPYADPNMVDDVIRYAYALATKYGEASGTLACEMYDAVAELSGVIVPSAVPANTATYGDVAKAVQGTMLQSRNPEVMTGSIDRLVKMVSVDTMQQNALRDGAEWAWIPSGDTCAFCIMLASNGWQRASKKAIKGGHAEHVHANCDCTYAIRFDSNTNVEGYDPDKYLKMYEDAPLDKWNTPDGKPPEGHENAEKPTPKNRINAMRRQFYAENGTEEANVN